MFLLYVCWVWNHVKGLESHFKARKKTASVLWVSIVHSSSALSMFWMSGNIVAIGWFLQYFSNCYYAQKIHCTVGFFALEDYCKWLVTSPNSRTKLTSLHFTPLPPLCPWKNTFKCNPTWKYTPANQLEKGQSKWHTLRSSKPIREEVWPFARGGKLYPRMS